MIKSCVNEDDMTKTIKDRERERARENERIFLLGFFALSWFLFVPLGVFKALELAILLAKYWGLLK